MNAIEAPEKRLLEMTLKAAIIYDDFDFAARAAVRLERVAARADEAIQWNFKFWRLDLLQLPSLADDALEETDDADLIVVASGGTRILPDELMEWLEDWAAHRKIGDAALMMFSPDENTGAQSLAKWLKPFAEWHGLAFLDCRIWREDQESVDFIHRLGRHRRLPQPVGPTPELFVEASRPPRHWGINE